jgi:hypothetical protein
MRLLLADIEEKSATVYTDGFYTLFNSNFALVAEIVGGS